MSIAVFRIVCILSARPMPLVARYSLRPPLLMMAGFGSSIWHVAEERGMTEMRDTRRTDFRRLRFESIDECETEVKQLLDADRTAGLHASGNWTPGQIFSHLAAWIEYGYDGYPLKPPNVVIRWLLRLGRGRILRSGMSRGVRIPGVKEGTTGMDAEPTQQAGERFLRALQRLKAGEEARFHSPAFGPMSHDERVRLNLRHAELHLGFLRSDSR